MVNVDDQRDINAAHGYYGGDEFVLVTSRDPVSLADRALEVTLQIVLIVALVAVEALPVALEVRVRAQLLR